MEAAPSQPVKQRGWVDKISLPVLRFSFFYKAWHLAKQLIPLRSSHPLQR